MMIVQARWMMHRLEDLASKKGLPFYDEWYLEEDQPFLRWLNQIETEGVGDAEATEMMREIVAGATEARARAAKETEFKTITMPEIGSVCRIKVSRSPSPAALLTRCSRCTRTSGSRSRWSGPTASTSRR